MATAITLTKCLAKPHVSGDTWACLAILHGYLYSCNMSVAACILGLAACVSLHVSLACVSCVTATITIIIIIIITIIFDYI